MIRVCLIHQFTSSKNVSSFNSKSYITAELVCISLYRDEIMFTLYLNNHEVALTMLKIQILNIKLEKKNSRFFVIMSQSLFDTCRS